jgi:hypothetical protein
VRAGLLRIRYWAIDPETDARSELIAETVQRGDGGYDTVFCADSRAIDAVLEMRSGDEWMAVRTRRVPAGTARVLPTGAEI